MGVSLRGGRLASGGVDGQPPATRRRVAGGRDGAMVRRRVRGAGRRARGRRAGARARPPARRGRPGSQLPRARRGRAGCARRRRTPWASAASVPASRSRGRRCTTAPTKSLRETASSSGRPSACSRGSARSASTVWAGLLPKSGPGSRTVCSAVHTALCAAARRVAQEGLDVARDVVVVEVEHLLLGPRAGVHEHERGARARAHVRQPEVGEPADVVDDRGAGLDGRGGHLGLVGVHGDEHVELARDPLDDAGRRARSPPPALTAGRWTAAVSPPTSTIAAPASTSSRARATRWPRFAAPRRPRRSRGSR